MIKIFPNPTNQIINIVLDNYSTENFYLIKIFDLKGKNINSYQIHSSKNKIDLKKYKPSSYYIVLYENDTIIDKQLIQVVK
ncbi:MAG: hypothetical protein Kow0068_11680 [Marinilabiliales bacterium]